MKASSRAPCKPYIKRRRVWHVFLCPDVYVAIAGISAYAACVAASRYVSRGYGVSLASQDLRAYYAGRI